uniref:serine/threonine-protein phosphatase 2A activator-like isoform X1 n=2 Tax=Myxine glutinosa TaxID=7769 RepID=UPI00358F6BF5
MEAESKSNRPKKEIHNIADMEPWKRSQAYSDIMSFILSLNSAVKGLAMSSDILVSETVRGVMAMLDKMAAWQAEYPPVEQSQRFGNRAFRTWHGRLVTEAEGLVKHLCESSKRPTPPIPSFPSAEPCLAQTTPSPVLNTSSAPSTLPAPLSPSRVSSSPASSGPLLVDEPVAYLLESMGNPTRLDYGTGSAPLSGRVPYERLHRQQRPTHPRRTLGPELRGMSWLSQCSCAASPSLASWCPEIRLPSHCESSLGISLLIGGVLCFSDHVVRYLDLVHGLQTGYRLEPAGSQGVWGLDDFHFLPFIWGSAQLIGHPSIEPKHFVETRMVEDNRQEYIFLKMIHSITQVKSGPFAEHSNQLWNISGVPAWTKVNSGLIKMYRAECLEKFPVVQHFLFGSLLPMRAATPGTQNLLTSSRHPASNMHRLAPTQ